MSHRVTRPLFAASLLLLGASAAQAQTSDLLISEYIEGASFNKAIEIYNGTGAAVDLTTGQYRLELHVNGAAAASQSVALTGTLANGAVLVFCNSGAVADILNDCDVQNNTVINHNGDDAFVLRKGSASIGTGTIVDSIGANTGDPGTTWGTGDFTTQDHTLRRQATVCTGDVVINDAVDPSVQWNSFPVGTHDGLESHTESCTPTLSIDDVSQAEGDGATSTYTFTVTLTTAASGAFTVDYTTQDGTAQDDNPGTEDEDYLAAAGTLNFAGTDGESHTIEVTVNGDTEEETDEAFDIVLSNISLAGVVLDATNGSGTGTIENDDVATPTLTIDDVSKNEGSGGGTTTYTFIVSLNAAAGAGGVTFDIATADGTAIGGGDDFATNSLTGQTIAAGNTSYSFDVTVDADDDIETDETFAVDVSNVTGAIIGDAQGTGTILNDDAPIFEINEIQGPTAFSPIVTDPNPNDSTIVGGVQVKVVGAVVTAVTRVVGVDGSPADQNGFFMQSTDADADADPLTSEGILVFTGSDPTVNVGDVVTVVGEAQERFSQTQISTSVAGSSVTVTTPGPVAMPTAVEFSSTSGIPSTDPADLSCPGTGPGTGNNAHTNFECFEGMRVSMPEAVISAANQRRASDLFAEAYVTPYGNRSRREEGLVFPLALEAGNTAAGQWDGNPELLEIDLDEAGLANTELTAGSTFSASGVIGFSFGDYEFYPTSFTPLVTKTVPEAVMASAGGDEMTVGTFNMQHLCDDPVDDGCERDTPVSTAPFTYADKLRKVSAYVRTVLNSPDVLGVQEVDELSTLADLSSRIVDEGGPAYQTFLAEGDDVGGIDVGFMVRADRITGASVEQFLKGATWPDPNGPEILHDRPPLLLSGTFNGVHPFAVLNNHTKSIGNVDGTGPAAERDRAKRFWQARDIANLVQQFQTATGPFAGEGTDTVPLILVGDYNAFEFSDGHVDVIGLISGIYDDAANECNATLSGPPGTETCNLGANIVDPPLYDTVLSVPAHERFSYLFTQDFNAVQGSDDRDVPAGQTIDHVLLARSAQGFFLGGDYGIGNNAAATETNRAVPPVEPPLPAPLVPASPIRASDHDGYVAYLDFDCENNATLNPDSDTVCGMLDNCPNDANDDQADGDGDGVGDACDVNNVPVATDDATTVAEGGTVTTVNGAATTVQGNDTDAEDGVPGGNVTIGTNPANASAFLLNSDGTFSYTHNGGETTTDSFTYTVVDSDGAASNVATVTITITGTNDAPVAVNDTVTVGEGGTATTVNGAATTVQANDTDAEDGVPGGTVTVGTGPANASAFTLNADGTFSYTHDGGETTTDSFTYTVADSGGATSATATVNITITSANDAPVISDVAATGTAEDTGTTVNFTVSDVDSAVTCANVTGASSNDAVLADAAIVVAGAAQACTATLTPVADANGSSTVTLTVTDGTLTGSDVFVLTVAAVNDAPSFAALPVSTTSNEDAGARTVAAFATGISAGPANEAGQSLTFTVTANSNPALFSVAPAIAADGTLTYTAAANANGTATITVELSDNGGGTDTSAPQSFDIVIAAQADSPAFAGDPYSFEVVALSPAGTSIGTVAATDVDAGDTLSYSINTSSAPGAVQIDAQTGEITVVQPALLIESASPLLLTVRVVDSTNRADIANVTIEITAALGEEIFANGFED